MDCGRVDLLYIISPDVINIRIKHSRHKGINTLKIYIFRLVGTFIFYLVTLSFAMMGLMLGP